IEHQRLLADRVRVRAQREAHVRVVQVVRGTDGDEVHPLLVVGAAALVHVPVEALELGEEVRLGKVAVDDPDRIVRVVRRHQAVAGIADRLHVPGGDVAGRADQGEIPDLAAHEWNSLYQATNFETPSSTPTRGR